MAYTLLLRLVAPLQSWGYRSNGNRRDTADYPTKSGVVGLLACVLGIPRDGDFESLKKLKFGIRVDLPGSKVEDFHITRIEGCKSNLSHRIYIQDGYFLAGLESEDRKELEKIEKALWNPEYAPYLGRKSCPPSFPLVLGIRDADLYNALHDEDWLVRRDRARREYWNKDIKKVSLRIIIEDNDNPTDTIKDYPISYSPQKRRYTYRGIKEMPAREIVLRGENKDGIFDKDQA